MARLIYTTIASFDGYVADADGAFDWAAPDEEVHAFVNDLERPIGTYLYGRRLYQIMAGWESFGTGPDDPPVVRAFGQLWRAADKIVVSTTLEAAPTARTRLWRSFEVDEVRSLKEGAHRDLSVGGPTLAAHAVAAGLVDEIRVFVVPIVVGGGTPTLPAGLRVGLRLLDERRFAGGTIYLRYGVRP